MVRDNQGGRTREQRIERAVSELAEFASAGRTLDELLSSLTPVQRRVVNLPPEARVLVTADAGTGKTHLLIARLSALIGEHGLSPGQEILVLSFTRAAVKAIKDRLRRAGDGLRQVSAVTFDSFATRLLSTLDPTGPWQDEGYDGRIEAAAEAIRAGRAAEVLRPVRHVFVDEVQDLVDVRAELVRAALEATDCGFTVLGDPAQGIYTWGLADEDRRAGASALFTWIRKRFAETLIDEGLDKNFRAQSEVAESALWAGPELNMPEPDYPSIRRRLVELVSLLPNLGGVDDAAERLRSGPDAQAAVLCRKNGEGLKISRRFFELQLHHRVQRAHTDRAVAPWVARTVGGSTVKTMGKGDFLRRVEELEDPSAPGAEEAWRLVRRLAGGRGDSLDLGGVAERIRMKLVPDELNWTPPARVIVSTIHRAKGLEFDRVVLLDGSDQEPEEEGELAEETRVLYVALTRPRYELFRMHRPPTWGMQKDEQSDRWYRHGTGKQRWQVHDVEVRGDDVHTVDPAGGFVIKGRDPAELQQYLASEVHPGDDVELVKRQVSVSGAQRVFYEIRHEGTPVGVTNEWFGGSLFGIIRRHWRRGQLPATIKNLHVDGVDTVAGTEAAGKRAGLGPSGIWLRARVSGLGYLSYKG
jgi:hypothetical protein